MIVLTNNQNNLEDLEKLQDALETVQQVDTEQVNSFFQETVLPTLISVGIKLLAVIVIYFVGTKLIKLARKILRRSLEKAQADVGLIQFLDSFMRIGLYALLVFGLFSWVGKIGVSLAAIIGSAGVAIGLALQGSLSNFAGGVLILLLKPFVVGDYIIEDSNNNEGTVKEIQLFYTKLLTADNKIIVIPNGALSNSSLTNVTEQDKRRLDLFVGIGYQSDIRLAKELLTDILKSQDTVLKDQHITVFVEALEDSSVKLGMRAWVKTDDVAVTKWKVLEEIKISFDKNDIEIPFTQVDITMKQ